LENKITLYQKRSIEEVKRMFGLDKNSEEVAKVFLSFCQKYDLNFLTGDIHIINLKDRVTKENKPTITISISGWRRLAQRNPNYLSPVNIISIRKKDIFKFSGTNGYLDLIEYIPSFEVIDNEVVAAYAKLVPKEGIPVVSLVRIEEWERSYFDKYEKKQKKMDQWESKPGYMLCIKAEKDVLKRFAAIDIPPGFELTEEIDSNEIEVNHTGENKKEEIRVTFGRFCINKGYIEKKPNNEFNYNKLEERYKELFGRETFSISSILPHEMRFIMDSEEDNKIIDI